MSIRHRIAALERQEAADPSIRAMSHEVLENEIELIHQDLARHAPRRSAPGEFDGMSLAELRAAVAALPPVSRASVLAMTDQEIDRQMALLFALREAERFDLLGE